MNRRICRQVLDSASPAQPNPVNNFYEKANCNTENICGDGVREVTALALATLFSVGEMVELQAPAPNPSTT